MRQIFIGCFLCFCFQVSAQSNAINYSGRVIDAESGIAINAVTVMIKGTDGNSFHIETDSLGLFDVQLHKNVAYKLDFQKNGYLNSVTNVNSKVSFDSVVTTRLDPLEQRSYLPEFIFSKNSSEVKTKALFDEFNAANFREDWRIKVVGYRSPDEPNELALKRAKEVVKGFVVIGVSPKVFISEGRLDSIPNFYYDREFEVEEKTIILRRDEQVFWQDINNVSETEKEAIYQFMRRVQLYWEWDGFE